MQLSSESLRAASRQTITGLDFYLTVKSRFAKMLARATNLTQNRDDGLLFDIAPRTFVLPDDYSAWHTAATQEPGTIWISKPGNGARGEGVYLVKDIDAVDPKGQVVVQECIKNPDLLGGYKYTLRFYVAVTSLDPLRVWVFPDGLAKLATQPFSASRDSLDNLFIHLTNPGVLRRDTSADYTQQRMTHIDYRRHLEQSGNDSEQLFNDIRTLIAKSLLAVREPVLHLQQRSIRPGYTFDNQSMLLGYDILVDTHLHPWIIEVNAGPSLEPEAGNTAQGVREQQIKDKVAKDMLVLAGRLSKAKVRFESLFPSSEMRNWLPCYEVIRNNDRIDLEKINKPPRM